MALELPPTVLGLSQMAQGLQTPGLGQMVIKSLMPWILGQL